MLYAQIIEGLVHGVFEYDPLPEFAPDIVMIPLEPDSEVGVGWRYEDGEFSPVEIENPPQEPRQITRLAFLSRFTDEEAVAIDLASIGATAEAAMMRRYLSKVEAASFIDLEREDLRLGVLSLEPIGILAEGRALEILDNPVEPHEVPL